jgi:transposase
MSAAYWAAVAEHLPRAVIVFDRFHLTQLVNHKLDDLRRDNVQAAKLRQFDEALKHNGPLFTGYQLPNQ